MYPAFAVAEAIQAADGEFPPVDLIFVGSARGVETGMVARSGVQWAHTAFIQSGPVHGVGPLRMLSSAARLAVGLAQALGLVARWRPQRVFLTGGWASLPVALAAWLGRVPLLGFVPDVEPGWALRWAGRFARRVAATVQDTAAYFPPGKVVETGYPLRQSILRASRQQALAHFRLDPARQTLLVAGGSRGARSINRAFLGILPDVLADGVQVLHVSGPLDWPEVCQMGERLDPAARARYHAFDYLHDDMGLALAAADLVVSRAGASTLGEYPQFGLPAVLVPYPYAWRYQQRNAEYLVSRGAALSLADDTLAEALYPTVRRLLSDPATLRQMSERARALARPDGARNIARLLLALEAR